MRARISNVLLECNQSCVCQRTPWAIQTFVDGTRTQHPGQARGGTKVGGWVGQTREKQFVPKIGVPFHAS